MQRDDGIESVAAVVGRVRPDWKTAEIELVSFLTGGYSNRNYRIRHRGEDFVVRVPGRARAHANHAAEVAFLRARETDRARDRGRVADLLEFPDVVAYEVDSGTMITRYVEGPLLSDAPPSDSELVGYLRALHALLPRAGRRYDPLEFARQSLRAPGAPEWIVALANTLDWKPEDLVGSHNDLNPWNVIRTPTARWLTLDWESYGDNDPLFDLVTLQQGLDGAVDALPALAAALLGSAVSTARIDVLVRVFWLREYAWAHAERAAGGERTEIVDQCALTLAKLEALR